MEILHLATIDTDTVTTKSNDGAAPQSVTAVDHPVHTVANCHADVTADREPVGTAPMLYVTKSIRLMFLHSELFCFYDPHSDPPFTYLKKY